MNIGKKITRHQNTKKTKSMNRFFGDESCNMKLDTDYGRIRENHTMRMRPEWNNLQ